MRHDGRVALADAGGLDHDQVEAGALAGRDHVGQGGADLAAEVARGERTHEHAWSFAPGRNRVHADAITQQRAAALAARRVDGDHRHAQPVVLVQPQAADEFIGEGRLARAAGAGDAKHGHLGGPGLLTQGRDQRPVGAAVLQHGDELCQCAPVHLALAFDGGQRLGRVGTEVLVAAHHHLADHPCQAHLLAVFRAVDARHAVVLQLADLGRHDHAATAAEHLNVLAAAALEQVHHVLEVLHVGRPGTN